MAALLSGVMVSTAPVSFAAAGADPKGAIAAPAAPAAPSSIDAFGSAKPSIAHGQYVARAADCQSCHTAPDGKPYAGGYALKSQFGTIYGTNITPDPQTGIGSWTEADFERALRHGVRKDGAYLYPAMPYDSYTKMSAGDLKSLWLYMRSIEPVSNTIPKNTLPFPLTVRTGLAVWQSLYFKPGLFQPVAERGPSWNRGAYLVQALGHCDACHTPRNIAQGLETQHQLTGAQIEGWYAPDISNDPLSKISKWSVDQLAQFLKTGTMPDNVKAFGPMQEAIHDSLRYLTDADLKAIAGYLKDQHDNVKPQRPTPVRFERLSEGKRVYEDNCISCHQTNGKGLKANIPALVGNDSVTAEEPYNVVMAILEGFPPQGSWGAMASFANTLTDDQIADVTNYVRTAWGNGGIPNATPWSVGSWRKNADAPKNESHALLCPNLPATALQPALGAGFDALRGAATDRAKMAKLVASYRSAVPMASRGDVIEALSTAYCRAVANDPISEARMSALIADFAQRVAAVGNLTPTT